MATTLIAAPRTVRAAAPRRSSRAVYRRRRVVAGSTVAVTVALLGAVVSGALAGPGGVPASAAGAQPAIERTVLVVRPGDTLWAIAGRYHGDVDFGRYLDALVTLNGGAAIQAGQRLTLP